MAGHTGPWFLTIVFTVFLWKQTNSFTNVARGRPAEQSGEWGGYGAERAVDGKYGPLLDSGECAHPSAGTEEAWWRVDLGHSYDVYTVKIFNRNFLQERLNDSWVLVSDIGYPTTDNNEYKCNYIKNGKQDVVEIKCDYDNQRNYIRGQYVTIKKAQNSHSSHQMNICEVEVFSCFLGTWGLSSDENCTHYCHNCNQGICTVSNGHCLENCSEVGKFGKDCDQECHCEGGNPCDRYSRSCGGAGCDDGYGGNHHCTIKLPKGNIPKVEYSRSNGSVILSWKGNEENKNYAIDHYKIIVEEESSRSRSTLPNKIPNKDATQSGQIELEIAVLDLPFKKTGFRVKPFITDRDAIIDGLESELSRTVTKPSLPETSSDSVQDMNIGLIAGIAVAVIILIILIIIVIVLVTRYRKSGKQVNNKTKGMLISSSQSPTNDHTYENPVVTRQNEDTLQSVNVDNNKYDIPKRSPVVNGIMNPPPGSQTPELLPSGDEDDQIYDNPIIIPPIKVSELSSYIEKRKGEADAFKREYQQLPAGDKAKWEIGNKAENRNKNRFVNIRAYDHSRVVLSIVDGDIHSDYINADFITGYKDKPRVYVAAQGPKKCTVIDTWRMMWELNANRIVMVTNLVEGGKLKCEKYWPDTEETYGEYKVIATSNEVFADYSLKQFELTYKEKTRTVYHFHFTSWPDHGVPITATALLNFRRKVRSFDNLGTGPMVVHCSAGVGRTGTFIALDTLLEQARVEDEVDVYGYGCVMRSNRVNMIQTLEQYIFVYDGLLEALMSGDTSIPCPELASRYEEMKNINPETNKSKLQDQFDVLEVLKPAKREEKLTALEPQNKDKNRDVDIVPSNRFRPFLSIKVEGCTDYINAVYIDGYKMRLAYIITQSPLPNTITDMWRLAYDHASRTIVMLNQLSDGDDDCPVYWPKDKETPLEFEPLTVSLVDETVDSVTPSITVRDFSIVHSSKPNNPVIVKQFHLTNWAEGESLPESKDDILDVMELVERWQQQSGNGPVTIHCRNGCDKSGLYCAASYTVEKLKLDREVDVFHAVKHVRVCRPAVVPTMEQYMYLHELALEYIDKFEIYANFK